jgi:glycosyltransferase involved in cell wall biosynthesis
MARVAVFHNTLDFRGGADVVCLHTCAALARDHEVTLVTVSETDPAELAARFDVPFDARVLQPRWGPAFARGLGLTGPHTGPQLAARSVVLRAFLRRHLDRFDAVVSTANELSLSIPSVQYVHFPQFHLDRTEFGEDGRLDGLWSRLAAPEGTELAGPQTRLLANSAWTADVVASVYGVRPAVCHPPVDPVDGRPWAEREAGVLVLGRIAPDKRTLDAVRILDRLRDRGYDLTAHVVGSAPPPYREYVAQVRAAAAGRPYLTVETDVSRDRVESLLGRYRYGLNTKPREHFGMAVAEYVAAGMLPFAPAEGGQADVLAGDERLLFDGVDGAVDRIAAAIDADRRPTLPRDRFGADRFAGEMRTHVGAILK